MAGFDFDKLKDSIDFDKLKGSAEDLATEFREKAGKLVHENGDKIDDALVKVRDKAKEMTGGKYDAKIDKAHDAAKGQIHKLGDDAATTTGGADETPSTPSKYAAGTYPENPEPSINAEPDDTTPPADSTTP